MKGSHNSCTYLPCKKWWMYLVNWAVKCQSKSLSGQFLEGVRYFDIRVRYNKNEENPWTIAHGLVEYKADINKDILEVLECLAAYTNERVYVRFLLEYNKVPDDFATKIIRFEEYLDWARGTYHHLTFHTLITKWNEYSVTTWSEMEMRHAYSSILGWKRFLWIPYWYAVLHNRKIRESNKDLLESKDKVLLMDFINK